ncbi:MAG: sulfotransferase [Cytophagaceae bacterium]
MKKFPILYILSNGRSGSTILDVMIGSHPEIWTVGELQNLPKDYKANKICGCGNHLIKCEFWAPISSKIPIFNIPDTFSSISYFRDKYPSGKVIRFNMLKFLLSGKPGKWKNGCYEYGLANHQLFQQIKVAAENSLGTEIKWIADASKDPYRLIFLKSTGFFDIKVIHITKDPRALTYSMTKEKFKSLSKCIRFTGKWFFENLTMTIIGRRHFSEDEFIHIRYEDLVTNPSEVFQKIGNKFKINFDGFSASNFRAYKNHGISGNQSRWRKSSLELDTTWKTKFNKGYSLMSWIISYPLASIYGYKYK